MLQLGLLLLRLLLLLLLLLRQLPTAPHTHTHRRIESCRQTGGCACTRGCMAAFGALLFWTPALHASMTQVQRTESLAHHAQWPDQHGEAAAPGRTQKGAGHFQGVGLVGVSTEIEGV